MAEHLSGNASAQRGSACGGIPPGTELRGAGIPVDRWKYFDMQKEPAVDGGGGTMADQIQRRVTRNELSASGTGSVRIRGEEFVLPIIYVPQ
jgi:hypothetical protein